ncbi:hypothetical protein [Streptomyces iconiensis]|uniref:Uncharacterized protein n=1 Tax=Streptomyces iconiensis TaxID=1384038 RepID=A0ABT6ZUI6_9ACTN|nr:hypothetical protein [Streptomyces iconiensis]MDJ1132727.1 hypothetical protein [Streptomyces iconiensis]
MGKKPTWQGVWFIEFVGMLAAHVTGAGSLRKVRGNSSPYHVLINLLLLRLPVGALTALVGVVLLSGKFFPGLNALDTSSQIIAWATAFGVLQEAVTRTIDRQGQHLLENVKAPGREQPEAGVQPPRSAARGRPDARHSGFPRPERGSTAIALAASSRPGAHVSNPPPRGRCSRAGAQRAPA